MNRSEKELLVKDLHEEFSQNPSVILLDYRGLNVAEITALRRKLLGASLSLRVVKNRLARRAVVGTKLEPLSDTCPGLFERDCIAEPPPQTNQGSRVSPRCRHCPHVSSLSLRQRGSST